MTIALVSMSRRVWEKHAHGTPDTEDMLHVMVHEDTNDRVLEVLETLAADWPVGKLARGDKVVHTLAGPQAAEHVGPGRIMWRFNPEGNDRRALEFRISVVRGIPGSVICTRRYGGALAEIVEPVDVAGAMTKAALARDEERRWVLADLLYDMLTFMAWLSYAERGPGVCDKHKGVCRVMGFARAAVQGGEDLVKMLDGVEEGEEDEE